MGQIFVPGTAGASDVAAGKKFSAGTNYDTTGTLTDYRPNAGTTSYVAPQSVLADTGGNIAVEPKTGAYSAGVNGLGYGTILITDPDFVPANWRADKNFFGAQGAMPVRSTHIAASNINGSGTVGRLYLLPPEGYYDGVNPYVYYDDPNFVAANIKSGATMLGLTGSFSGKQWAQGQATVSSTTLGFTRETGAGPLNRYHITVSGLGFTPSKIFYGQTTAYYWMRQVDVNRPKYSGYTIVKVPDNLDLRLDGTNAYISASGFRLPCDDAGLVYDWLAIE